MTFQSRSIRTGILHSIALAFCVMIGAPVFKAAVAEDRLPSLPFKIEAVEPFRIVEADEDSVVLTAGAKDIDIDELQPLIVAAFSQAKGEMSDLAGVAERSLKETAGFEAAVITFGKAVTFAGLNGYVLQGAFDQEGNRKTFVQYIGIGSRERALRLIAVVPVDAFDGLEDAIEKVAATVEFKD